MKIELCDRIAPKVKPISKWFDLVTMLLESHRAGKTVRLSLEKGEYFSPGAIKQHVFTRTRKGRYCQIMRLKWESVTSREFQLWLEPFNDVPKVEP